MQAFIVRFGSTAGCASRWHADCLRPSPAHVGSSMRSPFSTAAQRIPHRTSLIGSAICAEARFYGSRVCPERQGDVLIASRFGCGAHKIGIYGPDGRRSLVTVSMLSPAKIAPSLRVGSPAPSLLGPAVAQTRNAGRILGTKRKKKASRPRTVHQTGLGKRMEFYWPKHSHRTRVPMYEDSRQHVIWDHHLRRWLVMWYRDGMQVFRSFSAKQGSKFERARARAIVFYKQLKDANKLGRPKPDQCRSGVRGVFFDREERAWVARWIDIGMKKYAVFSHQEHGFSDAYQGAVRHRVQATRQNHQFIFQRTRWKGQRRPLGTPQT